MAYKLSVEEEKEATEFMTRLFGSLTTVGEQLVLDFIYATQPAMRSSPIFQRLAKQAPTNAELIVAGVSAVPYLIGVGMEEEPIKKLLTEEQKKLAKPLRQFGEGQLLFSAPMLVRSTAVQNIPAQTVASAPPPSPSGSPPTQGRVIKL